MYEIAKETLMYRTVLWTLWERERVGRFGRVTLRTTALTRVPGWLFLKGNEERTV